jgi:hypothetical protein
MSLNWIRRVIALGFAVAPCWINGRRMALYDSTELYP